MGGVLNDLVINDLAFPVSQIPRSTTKINDLRTIQFKNKSKTEQIKLAVYRPNDFYRMEGKKTIIYCHGNCEDVFLLNDLMKEYAEEFGQMVVSFDWCGYGESSGKPSEHTLLLSIEAVYEYIIQQYDLQPQQIIVWGRSIGTVAAIYLGTKYPVKVICQSPPASAFDAIWEEYKMPFNQLKSFERIKKVQGHITVIHGTADGVVPIRNGLKLVKIYSGWELDVIQKSLKNAFEGVDVMRFGGLTYYQIEDGGHNDLESQFRDQLMFCVKE
ncbi:Alpha/beta_hydrolase family protein [Hexamita inflata]|uniref:Alpha/beta hydrolase family protein n=1 Tax=Hexamita inflata TaxID=28002 RepID=A0AA86UPS9_9EUKA|nr:Alpha/beta hydrolase family protein [Hexamita inflata]